MSPAGFRVLWPDVGLKGTMSRWLVGSGIPRRTLCASCAVRMNWPRRARRARRSPPSWGCRRRRCTTGAALMAGWIPTPPRSSRSCASRTPASSACWPRPSWSRTRCGRSRRKILSPAAKRRAVDMLTTTLSMSERLACKAVGLARSTYRRLPVAQTPADPDAEMRAWAALRYDERREVNKKKVHWLWREEGLQVRVHSPRKRAGVSSIPPIEADAPGVVWAIDFLFDSTIDGKAIKIASMIDEHTRCSLLHLVERSDR